MLLAYSLVILVCLCSCGDTDAAPVSEPSSNAVPPPACGHVAGVVGAAEPSAGPALRGDGMFSTAAAASDVGNKEMKTMKAEVNAESAGTGEERSKGVYT